MKPNAKLKESKRKRKEKSKDSVNSKRRLPIDKLKLMPSELREPSRKVKDKPEKEKDLNNKREKEFKPILRSLDKDNSLRSSQVWQNKQESNERTT